MQVPTETIRMLDERLTNIKQVLEKHFGASTHSVAQPDELDQGLGSVVSLFSNLDSIETLIDADLKFLHAVKTNKQTQDVIRDKILQLLCNLTDDNNVNVTVCFTAYKHLGEYSLDELVCTIKHTEWCYFNETTNTFAFTTRRDSSEIWLCEIDLTKKRFFPDEYQTRLYATVTKNGYWMTPFQTVPPLLPYEVRVSDDVLTSLKQFINSV